LIIVGGYMFKNVKDLDFTDMKSLFPAFIIIVAMPLTYSISIGLSLGFLAYILLHLLTGDFKKINFTLLFIGALCFVNLIV
ncbi:MAG: NCS2 family permease, partial [Fusobacterium sp.]